MLLIKRPFQKSKLIMVRKNAKIKYFSFFNYKHLTYNNKNVILVLKTNKINS